MSLPTRILLAFDIYPGGDPRDGARLIRIKRDSGTQGDGFLDGTHVRKVLRGLGKGTLILHSLHPAVVAGHIIPGNYVRVVDITDAEDERVVFGFWLDEGEEKVLARMETGAEIRQMGGPGVLYYLNRATLSDAARATFAGPQDIVDGYWRGIDHAAAVLRRALLEVNLQTPPRLPDIFIDEAGGVIIGDGVQWDDVTDSGSNAWPAYTEEWRVGQVGDPMLDLALDVIKQGVDLLMDPDLFVLTAYLAGTYGTDRTSATFAAGKVRFEGGVNITADLSRAIRRLSYVSHMRAIGSDGVTTVEVVDSDWLDGDPVYAGTVYVDSTVDTQALEDAATEAIRLRKLGADVAKFPHLPGDDEATGRYRPGTHYDVGDLVTLHSGTDGHDYDEQAIQVAAIEWVISRTGDFMPHIELGSQYLSAAAAAEIRSLTTIIRQDHSHPLSLCDPTILGTEPNNIAGDGTWSAHNLTEFAPGDDPDALLTDGDTSVGTYLMPWALDPYWAVDFGSATTVYSIRVWHSALTELTPVQFQVRGASLADWSDEVTLATIAGATGDNGLTTFASPSAYRYYRLVNTGGTPPGADSLDGWQINEVETYDAAAGSNTENPLHGTSPKAARCDHTHVWNADRAPNADDDAGAGYPEGTFWHVIGGATYVSVDDSTGAAVWDLVGSTSTGSHSHDAYVFNRFGGLEIVNTVATSGSAQTIDLADGNIHDVTLSDDCTFTMPSEVDGASFTARIRQPSSGGPHTATFTGVEWPGSVAPTLSTAADAVDILTFHSDGTVWFGSYAGAASSVGALDDLSDVTITTPTAADRLRFNGSVWVNSALKWVPVMTYDGTNWLVAVDGSGNAVITEA